MFQKIAHVTIVVHDYDDAIRFYVDRLGFILVEDTVLNSDKRWVLVAPSADSCQILLAKAVGEQQLQSVGNQTGKRVGFFLYTDDFDADFKRLTANGIEFVRPPKAESYGIVAVFLDLYGNLWDLIQPI
ncbi:MAG: hypothetical protein RLY16_1966 [Bacteroidota bacterium]|jgi:catechol 2,3-dioxygenase-like lactoylglutathione lyase family enzyme